MNKTYTLGWLFLITSLFFNYNANIICASIFFAAHYVIEEFKNESK